MKQTTQHPPRTQPAKTATGNRIAAAVAAALAAVGVMPEQTTPAPRPPRTFPRLPTAWKQLVVQYLDPTLVRTAFPMEFTGFYRLQSGRPTAEYRVVGRDHIVAHVGMRADGGAVVAHCVGGVRPEDFRISM